MEPQNPLQPPYKAPGEPTPTMNHQPAPAKPRRHIVRTNILIFLGYMILSYVLRFMLSSGVSPVLGLIIGIIGFATPIHILILVVLGIISMIKKDYQGANMYFFSLVMMFIVGFGLCMVAVFGFTLLGGAL